MKYDIIHNINNFNINRRYVCIHQRCKSINKKKTIPFSNTEYMFYNNCKLECESQLKISLNKLVQRWVYMVC